MPEPETTPPPTIEVPAFCAELRHLAREYEADGHGEAALATLHVAFRLEHGRWPWERLVEVPRGNG